PCVPVSATRTITIVQASTANAGGPDIVCQSSSPSAITLSGATIGGGATTGAWSITSGGGTLSSTAQTGNPATVTYTPAANFSGTVTLTLTTNALTGYSPVSVTRTITINPLPSVPTITSAARCGPGVITLSASGCAGGTLNWYDAA